MKYVIKNNWKTHQKLSMATRIVRHASNHKIYNFSSINYCLIIFSNGLQKITSQAFRTKCIKNVKITYDHHQLAQRCIVQVDLD